MNQKVCGDAGKVAVVRRAGRRRETGQIGLGKAAGRGEFRVEVTKSKAKPDFVPWPGHSTRPYCLSEG